MHDICFVLADLPRETENVWDNVSNCADVDTLRVQTLSADVAQDRRQWKHLNRDPA
jgi:hypothetical protein